MPRWILALCIVLVIVLAGFVTAFGLSVDGLRRAKNKDFYNSWALPPPSESPLEKYLFTAVASDSDFCSVIGNYIMTVKKGSAVDGAISTHLCNGVMNMHSTGLGGGSFMLIYEKKTGKIFALDYRETAPKKATKTMFVGKGKASTTGGLAIAVPGQIAGHYEAWKKFGKLPWKELFQPVIDMCLNGYRISSTLAQNMKKKEADIKASPGLRELLVDNTTNTLYKLGHVLINKKLADTFKAIANDPYTFYNGTLAQNIVQEITNASGIISLEDLKDYRPIWRDPIKVPLPNSKFTVYGLPPPSSGIILAFMLGILDGYKLSPEVKKHLDSYALYHHRVLEAFKFAYGKRSALGDINFLGNQTTTLLKDLASSQFAEKIRKKINDYRTYGVAHYSPSFDWKDDHGTSHLSLVSPDGDVVSVTSTINTLFGSKVRGLTTGIVYNNEMDDFSTPNTTNSYGIPSSPSNYIVPGKRPMSSMSPTIVLDKSGELFLVIGASGGSRITTSVAYISSKVLFLGDTIKAAIDYPRIHHQLVPNIAMVEKSFPKPIIDILKKKGHKFGSVSLSVCQGINKKGSFLFANSDFRKGGKPSGQ